MPVEIKSDLRSAVDPITFEVLRNSFDHACSRMSTIMQRTSFSPILCDMMDYSNAIYSPDVELLSQAANCPVHLAAMQVSAEAAVKKYPIETLRPGDVIALNDPYQGGTHINDITFTMPMFYEGTLLGFAVSRGHWMDFGGGAAGGQGFGTHIASEGLRLPPIMLYRDYEVNGDFLSILMANTRTPHYVKGDLQAHMAALRSAEFEIQRLVGRYGSEVVTRTMRDLIRYTERIVRNAIKEIPNGVYEAEDYADTDGFAPGKIGVKVKLIVSDDSIEVDLTGSDGPAKGAINSPYANTAAAIYYSLQFFLAPDAPSNYGMFVPIKITLPEKCWLNAQWPSPTIGCTTIASSKVCSAIWQALAKAIPERVTAPTYAECNWFVCATTDRAGRTDVFSDLLSGGWGGTPYNDGMSVTEDPLGNCTNVPAEAAELFYPIEYEAFELRPDSGGAGQYRGGLGSLFKVRFLCDAEFSIETSRTYEGSPGVNGGGYSPPQRAWKIGADGSTKVIGGITETGGWLNPLLAAYRFTHDEQFMFESTGGGGWGSPHDRPVDQVVDDVLDGYISVRSAKEIYGVVVDEKTFKLDLSATKKLRETPPAS